MVGSGTLVTFPVLIALGYAPVTASISNAMGLVAGNAAGAWGYRQGAGRPRHAAAPAAARLAAGRHHRRLPAAAPAREGLPLRGPVLIVLALLMVVFQPRLQRWVQEPRKQNPEHAIRDRRHGVLLVVLVYLAGVYGGYFVAAQGILLVGILGVFMAGTIQNANAMKNILVLGVNIVAAALLPAVRLRPDQLARRGADRRQFADRRPDRLQGGPPALPGWSCAASSSRWAWWRWAS